jgi:hypothetical protein
VALAGLASFTAWGLASWHLAARHIIFPTLDDFTRIVLAMWWAHSPYLTPGETFWLPLIYYVQGIAYLVVGHWAGFYWPHVTSSFFMGMAGWAVMAAAIRSLGGQPGAWRCATAGTTALAMMLSMPVAWRLAGSGLSEPIFLTWQGAMVWALIALGRRESRWAWGTLLVSSVLSQMSRYEGWPLAFAAWTIAHLLASSRGQRRWWWRLALGYAALSAWPLIWIGLNAKIEHDPFHFLTWAQVKSAEAMPEVAAMDAGGRMALLTRLAWQQGWIIVVLLPWGGWAARRQRELRGVALTFLAAVAIYYQSAWSNTIASALPARLCIGPLWMAVAPIAHGLAAIGQSRWRAAAAALVFLAALQQGLYWDSRQWGGNFLNDHDIELLETMRELASQDYVMVLDDPATTGGIENRLRVYAGPGQVKVALEYPPDRMTPGRFVYFFKPLRPPELPGVRYGMEHAYILLERMPPAEGVRAAIEASKGVEATGRSD